MSKRASLLFLALLLTFGFSSCDDESKFKELNAIPKWTPISVKESEKEVYLFLTGDLSQNIFPFKDLRPKSLNTQLPSSLMVGGFPILKNYLQIIKSRLPNNSIIINSGNTLDTQESSLKTEILTKTLAELPIDIYQMSSNDATSMTMASQDKELSQLPWLTSNILEIKNTSSTTKWNSKEYRILEADGLLFGVFSISNYENLSAKKKNSLRGQYFQDALVSVLKTKNQLKAKYTDFNILIFESSETCDLQLSHLHRKFTKMKYEHCLRNSQLEKLIKRLPPNSLDLVITNIPGLSGAIIDEVPILSTIKTQGYITPIRLLFAEKKLVMDKSYLLTPIRLCQKMFAGAHDCRFYEGDEDIVQKRDELLEKTAYGLIPARFLGHELKPDEKFSTKINDIQALQNHDK